jgi:hypothetical protein
MALTQGPRASGLGPRASSPSALAPRIEYGPGMDLYDLSVPQFSKMLQNVDRWLELAVAYAKAKKFEPDELVTQRLAPDMFTLARQVQSACDAAKFACAYLTGKQPPSHPDTEKTIDELRTRIRTVRAHLETYKREDFAGAADRKVSPPWLGGKWLTAPDYLLQASIPNFFFHVTTAYNILRHSGVDTLGKHVFIGQLPIRD